MAPSTTTLARPVELIRVQRRGSAAFKCAVAEMQGWRSNHEDAHSVHCGEKTADFWVLDGHRGSDAATFGADALAQEIGQALDGENLPANSEIHQGLETVDGMLRNHLEKDETHRQAGSTVVGALIAQQSNGFYTAKMVNCGDSRGVIVRGPEERKSSAHAATIRLPQHFQKFEEEDCWTADASWFPSWPAIVETIDHKPSHPLERARIEAAGGRVSGGRRARIDGNLSVSRGLGDFDFKDDINRSTSEQKVRQSHNRIPGGPTLNVLAGGGNVCATDTEQSPPAEMMKYGPYVTGDAGREMGVHCARLDVSDSEPDSDHASQRDTVNIKMPPIPEFPIFAEYEALDREGSSWGTDSQRARNNRKGKGVTTKHEILNVRNNTGSEAVTAKQQQPRVAAPVAVIADPFGLNSFLAGPVSLGDEKHEALLFLRRKLLDYPKDDGKHCNVEHSIKRIDDKLAEARSN